MYLSLLFKLHPYFATACVTHKFFFLPPWYEYLPFTQDAVGCSRVFHFPGDIWAVGLALIDLMLRLAGFVAVISIIIAGFQYMTTLGNAEKGVSARKRIINSLIGLAIVLIATTLVTFIGKNIGS